jgi:deoxyribonuclease IV
MLIGAHVSKGGGLPRAHERGAAIGCEAIQIFHTNPRTWRLDRHTEDQASAFRELAAAGPPTTVVIHAVYLINCASKDREIRRKSIESLIHALRLGDEIGAEGVVLHPGSRVGEPLDDSLARVGDAVAAALAESERCPLLFENTAGAGGTLGRSFAELADLVERAGGGERIGLCLDCCHLLASGFDVRNADGLAAVVDECIAEVGLERLRCLHVNDSQTTLGSNRDRHANLPEGELGRRGLSAFLSEPRFEGLPALLEVPGRDGKGPDAQQVSVAKELRRKGLAARARRAGRTRPARTRARRGGRSRD